MKNFSFVFNGSTINSKKDITDWKVRSRLIKNRISKFYGNIYDFLDARGHVVGTCVFCGRRNSIFGIITELLNGEAHITGLEYKYSTNVNGYKNYCFVTGTDCPGKKLNPNSREFVSKVLGCSEDQALKVIHNRNSSPFYRSSFDSDDDYIRSQSRGEKWREAMGITKEEQGAKVSLGHSVSAYKERYGDSWEEVKKKHNLSKVNTKAAFIARHGELGETKYYEYLAKINLSLESFILRDGKIKGTFNYINRCASMSDYAGEIKSFDDIVLYALYLFSRTSLSTLTSFPISEEIKKSKCLVSGLAYFNKTVEDLVVECRKIDPMFMSINFTSYPTRSKYGYMFYSEDGVLFRSKIEFELYLELLGQGIDSEDIQIDGCYPGSKMRYDFFIKPTGTYIELAGLSGFVEYDKRIEEKIEQFNPIVITSENYQDSLIKIKSIYETRKQLH